MRAKRQVTDLTHPQMNHGWKIKRDLPIKSVGFRSMKFSQSLMNIAVVSLEGHSPWLKQQMALLLEDIQMVYAPWNATVNVPFTLKLHVFDAFFFDVFAVIKARSVRQIHKQAHFHLHSSDKDKRHGEVEAFLLKMSPWTSVSTVSLTFKLFRRLESMLGWNLFSGATWSSYLGPNIVFIGRNLPLKKN